MVYGVYWLFLAFLPVSHTLLTFVVLFFEMLQCHTFGTYPLCMKARLAQPKCLESVCKVYCPTACNAFWFSHNGMWQRQHAQPTFNKQQPNAINMASNQRRISRNIQTMQSMLLTHEHENVGPHLTAISTLYLSLLEGAAEDTVWQLFYKVAQLPLRAQAHVTKCKLQPDLATDSCFSRGGCHHTIVDTTVVVQLDPLAEHRLQHGVAINSQLVNQWWGNELDRALQAAGAA